MKVLLVCEEVWVSLVGLVVSGGDGGHRHVPVGGRGHAVDLNGRPQVSLDLVAHGKEILQAGFEAERNKFDLERCSTHTKILIVFVIKQKKKKR